MRRLLLRILAVLFALLIAAIIAVQVVLWTGFPRTFVIQQLETQLGLRVTAASLSTGWFGHTTLKNVSLSLPLAEKSFLEVPTLKVRHTWLPGMLLGRSLTIAALEFDNAHLEVVQGDDGRWNLQQVVALMGRSGGGNAAKKSAFSVLPKLKVTDATVSVVDRNNRRCTVDSITLDGSPDTPLSWRYTLKVPGHIGVMGRLAPGDAWQQQVDAKVSDIAPWLSPWFQVPTDLLLDAKWTGRVVDGQLAGWLDITRCTADGGAASGAVQVAQSNGNVVFRPNDLHISMPAKAIGEIQLLSGNVVVAGSVLRVDDLQLTAFKGPARCSGYVDLATRAGQISAAWDKLLLPGGIMHGGNITATLRAPFPGRIVLDGNLQSYGWTSQGPWNASLAFGADGDVGSDVAWHINGSEMVWSRRSPIRLDGLQLTGDFQRTADGTTKIQLGSLYLPTDPTSAGRGFYSLANHSWELSLSGQRWPVKLIEGTELSFNLDARGDSQAIQLQQFALRADHGDLAASGWYRFGTPKPLSVGVSISNHPSPLAARNRPTVLDGTLQGKADLQGTLQPVNVDLSGQLWGQDVRVANRDLGDIALGLSGEITPQRVEVRTERLAALGGNWNLRGDYNFPVGLLDIDLRVGGVSLQQLTGVANTKPIGGVLDGEWDATILSLPFRADRINLTGWGLLRDVREAGLGADEIHFTTNMEQGELTVDPIALSLGKAGHGQATLAWTTANPKLVTGTLQLTDWPLGSPAARAAVTLSTPAARIVLPQPAIGEMPARPLQIDVPTLDGSADLTVSNQPAGNLKFSATLFGQTINVHNVGGSLLGGTVNGHVFYDIAQPLKAQAALSLEQVDCGNLAHFVAGLNGLGGKLTLHAALAPATDPRALEPLKLGISGKFTEGHFRTIPLDAIDLNLFFNRDRVVLDDRVGHQSLLQLDDGTVYLWGRLNRRANKVWSTQAELRLDKFNLDHIVRAIAPARPFTPGKLSTTVTLLYDSRPPDARGTATTQPIPVPGTKRTVSPEAKQFMTNLYAEATLNIDHSDVGTVPVFAELYTLMSLGTAGSGPSGQGGSDNIRLERGTLSVSRIRYTNRGLDAIGQLTSPEMWLFPDNPISGFAAGSASPLGALKIPLVSDVSDALTSLQHDLTAVQISGTWRHYKAPPVALTNLGRGLLDILGSSGGGDSTQTPP
jgi:hypothetical protein